MNPLLHNQWLIELPFDGGTRSTDFWNERILAQKEDVTILTNTIYRIPQIRLLAHALKENDSHAIEQAAQAMRSILPSWDNVALVPVPSHVGYATYTLRLAEALGRGHIYDILRCSERETLYSRKLRGENVTANDLGFYTIGSIPEHMHVVFLDNVVASGITALAAHATVGRGTMVPFAIDTFVW